MTHKIYHIQNIDTGKGYVGITSGELGMRWYQHMHDPQSAIYKALRSDGHRMTMNLLEECEDRNEALAKEQQYICELNTAQPNGWNRRVSSEIAKPKPRRVQWIQKESPLLFVDGVLRCPVCWKNDGTTDGERLYFEGEPYHPKNDEEITYHHVMCESCHGWCAFCDGVSCNECPGDNPKRPIYKLKSWGTHAFIEMKMIVYVKADV